MIGWPTTCIPTIVFGAGGLLTATVAELGDPNAAPLTAEILTLNCLPPAAAVSGTEMVLLDQSPLPQVNEPVVAL